ncbi:MAG: hypothetical protein ACC707_14710 [Thiohalomonadales bacterium]
MTDTLTNIKKRLKKKSARINMFMNSELGQEVIKALEDEFYHGALFEDDPCKTAFNLGRRDVVVYLKELQNWRTKDE